MNPRKGTAGIVVMVTAVVSLCMFVGAGYAASDYMPTLLGNDTYSNHVDLVNDYRVEGIYYTAPISDQNTDTVAEARSLATTIGNESEAASPIIVTNNLGKTIEEFSFRSSADSAFPGSMLSASLADDESACWFYEYNYAEQDYTNSIGSTYAMPQNYLIQVVFSDGTTAEFHNINMNAVRTINLCYSTDYGVYYVERTTITNHTPDPNLYYEVNLNEYEGGSAEFNYHVNSGGGMGERAITASRGGGWDVGHDPLQQIEDFGIDLPLYGTSTGDYTDGRYDSLRWNSDSLIWRLSNNDV